MWKDSFKTNTKFLAILKVVASELNSILDLEISVRFGTFRIRIESKQLHLWSGSYKGNVLDGLTSRSESSKAEHQTEVL